MGNRSDLNILISFSKDGTTYARMSKISGFGTTASAKLLRTGTAKCHPDDKFDPQIGAMIAMARMFGNEVEFKSEKEEPERKLTGVEKMALDKGYTLVRDRLPSCKAYDGKYNVILASGYGGENTRLYWSHKYHTFTSLDHDNDRNSIAKDGEIARRIWMDDTKASPVIAWKAKPDKIEQKALDEGYTLCRDRYPDKSGEYDLFSEDCRHWAEIPWSPRFGCFGMTDNTNEMFFENAIRAWMTKGKNPAIAWKESK